MEKLQNGNCNDICESQDSKENLELYKEIGQHLQLSKNIFVGKARVEEYKLIKAENDELKPVLYKKIKELQMKQNSAQPEIFGTGNSCNSPVYEYNEIIKTKCPKCQGRVESEFENYYQPYKYYDDNGIEQESKYPTNRNICTEVKYNETIKAIDTFSNIFFKYFDKEDPEKKYHYVKNPKKNWVYEKVLKADQSPEGDIPGHYMMIDGEKYYTPYGVTLRDYFDINHDYFFPPAKDGFSFFKDSIYAYKQFGTGGLGALLGYYTVVVRSHETVYMTYIYKCNACGYKYHIINSSPFKFRDNSLDPK